MKLLIEENCTGEKTILEISDKTALCVETLVTKYFKELYDLYEVEVFFNDTSVIGEYYVALTENPDSVRVWDSKSVWVEIN